MAADGSPDNPIPAVRVEPVADVAAAAAAAPVAAAAVVPAVAEVAPAVVAAEPVAAAIPEAKVELVGEKPSLLETTGKPAEKAAAAEAKPESDTVPEKKPDAAVDPAKAAEKVIADKPAAEVAAAAAAPEPLAAVDYKYTLPATLKMDDALRGEAHAAFDAFRANPAEGAQALIDLHSRTMQTFADTLRADTLRDQHKAFNDTRDGWQKDIMADAEFGGSGFQTASKAVARMRDMLVSSAAPGTPEYQQHLKEAEDFYRITGAGDHPVLWRILHNAARFFDEPGLPPQNIKPAPGNGKTPGGKRDRMYDHPSSSKASP